MKTYSIFLLLLVPFLSISQPSLEWNSEYTTDNFSSFSYQNREAQFDSNENIISGIRNGTDWKILKHDPNGNLLWDFSYEHPDKISESISSFLIDSNDNIIVVGSTTTQFYQDWNIFDSESELIVLKISPLGNLLWTYKKAGATWTDNYATSVDIDENNNIYIAGDYHSNSNSRHAITIRLDVNGNQIWQNIFPSMSPPNSPISSSSLSSLSIKYINNSLAVVGRTGFSTNATLHFFKYDLNGNFLSENQVSDNYSIRYKFDELGNFYTYSYSGDFKMSKFDIDGNLIWYFEEPTNLPSNVTTDEIIDVSVDGNLNVYITGRHYGENYGDAANYTNGDILSLKLNASGQEIWRNRYENEGNNTAEIGNHIQVLEDGSAIVTGYRYTNLGSEDLNKIIYLLDANGNQIWFIDNDNGFMNQDVGYSSHVIGNALYVTGWEKDNNEEVNYVLKRYALTTNCIATLNINFPPGNGIYLAGNTINSNTTISNNVDVTFYAGNRVRLNTGFNVETGAKFKADINGCQN